jgi:hypothetical protein
LVERHKISVRENVISKDKVAGLVENVEECVGRNKDIAIGAERTESKFFIIFKKCAKNTKEAVLKLAGLYQNPLTFYAHLPKQYLHYQKFRQ